MKRKPRTKEQQIKAETTPLAVLAQTGTSHVLTRANGELLSLRPRTFFPLVGMIFGGGTLALGGYVVWQGNTAGYFIGVVGGVFVAVFLLLMAFTRRMDFDRTRGELVLRRLWSWRTIPLTSIQAVQLIEGGWQGGGSSQTPPFFTYQANLVLNNPDEPRLNMTNTSNWDATWTLASEVSEFLSVPLVNEVASE